jgi:predicted phage terminase large subunit-like protein
MPKMTPRQYQESIALVEAEQCRRDMHRFLRDVVWPVVEPGTEFIDNWHLHAICEHLQAVLNGDIANLLVNMPPRFAKSILISVTMPTWAWIDRPEMRSIFASYSANLSIRDALKSRRVINSPRYQKYYGDIFQLSDDQDVKARYENDKTGFRMSTSVGGMGTGEGGDVLVVDDPHNVLAAESDVVREEAWLWWTETMSSRLNNPNKGGKIVVMQRVNESDVSGHILAEQADEYCHLKIPMRYEVPTVKVTVPGTYEMKEAPTEKTPNSFGWMDPREVEGELAWPSRFDASAVKKLEKAMGSYAVAGQFQQRPAPRGGSMIDTNLFHMCDVLPTKQPIVWVRCWDLAATEEQAKTSEPAYTAGVLIGKWTEGDEDHFLIADVKRERLGPYAVRKLLKETAEHDGKHVKIRIPQDPGQAGKSQKDSIIAMLAGYTVVAVTETGSKEQRAEPFAAQVEGNNVWCLRGVWNTAYFAELNMFPSGKFKDQTDATANGFNELIPLPNNATNLMEFMQRKMAAMKEEAEKNGRKFNIDNPNADRTAGARNVTDLQYLLSTRR